MLRMRLTLPLVLAATAAVVLPAYLSARPAASSITVTEGLPKELAFKVAPAKVTSSPVVFNVTNKGKQPHSFKVCTKPSANAKANTCPGVATKLLAPGASQTLIVKLATSGTYEYLSGTASQAAAGMKGLLTVKLEAAAGGGAMATGTTTSPKGTAGVSSGGVVNGQATDATCPAGTLIAVGPGAGDQDDDNEGGFPTDGDGCL